MLGPRKIPVRWGKKDPTLGSSWFGGEDKVLTLERPRQVGPVQSLPQEARGLVPPPPPEQRPTLWWRPSPPPRGPGVREGKQLYPWKTHPLRGNVGKKKNQCLEAGKPNTGPQ